jgi:radical SAM protein with 4Fe4S-binding SPASM domain
MLLEFREVKDLYVEIPEDIIKIAEEKARNFGIKVVWSADVPKVKPPVTRCIEWSMPFIFVTGHVIPCCSGNEAGKRDFQKQTALGNIFEQSFKEIWYGEKYKKFRRMLREGKVPVQCKNCCLYNVESNVL